MSKKQYTLQKLTIELVSVLLASLVAFRICEMLSIKLAYLPIVLVGCYIVLKLLYSLSIIMVGYVMKLIPIIYKGEPRPILSTNMGTVAEYGSSEKNNDVLKKRMELFHYEYQSEQQEYAKRKEQEDDANLTAMLKYTRDTFFHLGFDEAEVFQICECVRYFLTNRQPLSNTEIRISKRSTVTQIALKNFAWNIAYPYNISGDATAAFVFNTFNEWFVNTTIATIKKNLRTTTGRHKIEIDEKILSKYLGDNAK